MNAAILVTAFSSKTGIKLHFMSGAQFHALLAEINQIVNKGK